MNRLDRSDQADNVEMLVRILLLVRDLASLVQLVHQARPLSTKLVGTGQRAISTTHGETVDAVLDQIVCCLQTAFSLTDCMSALAPRRSICELTRRTARRPNQSAALSQPTSHIVPTYSNDVFALQASSLLIALISESKALRTERS